MSIERTYYCDGPDCIVHCRTATPPPHLPAGFMELRGDRSEDAHFCSWDCLMKFAAAHPADERIEIDDLGDTDA